MKQLREYKKKRDFSQTKEPRAEIGKESSKNLRFVVQYHEARAKHYDFRLEFDGVLLSWAVPKGPSLNPDVKRLAVRVEDHPIDYINFEGNIPKGQYGGGTVVVWDKGNYAPLSDMKLGLEQGDLKIVLNGSKLFGLFKLFKTQNNNWLLVKAKDEFCDKAFDISEASKDMIKNPFHEAKFELAEMKTKLPIGDDWLSEIKYDGYRIMAFVENGSVKLLSRNNKDFSNKFSNVVDELKIIMKNRAIVFDGEMVVADQTGKTSFSDLQESIKKHKNNFTYMIFDVLALDGKDLRQNSLIDRKKKLHDLINESDCIKESKYVLGQSEECFDIAKKLGLEGIICKKINSVYTGKRSGNWTKTKCYVLQNFIVGGYEISNKTKKLSAVLLGDIIDNQFVYVGKAGTGFNDKTRKRIQDFLETTVSKKCYFKVEPNINGDDVFWTKPQMVVEVQFAEKTKDNLLRQASFKQVVSLGFKEEK